MSGVLVDRFNMIKPGILFEKPDEIMGMDPFMISASDFYIQDSIRRALEDKIFKYSCWALLTFALLLFNLDF